MPGHSACDRLIARFPRLLAHALAATLLSHDRIIPASPLTDQLIADFGGTMLWPMIALSNIAQGSAVLGMIYLQRKNAAAQEVNVPSCISCYLGVTEPAMFGVNLKFHFPFICGMIGSAIAAAVCVATSTTANAIVVPFVLTVSVGKKKGIA